MLRRRIAQIERMAKALRGHPRINPVLTAIARATVARFARDREFWAMHLARRGPVAARLPSGATLRLHADGDWVANQVYWKGAFGYEPETSRLFYERARSARVTLDIGAHVGYYALLAGHANPAGRVVAFEPHPDAFERLEAHVRLNRLRNVETVRVAAGAMDGRARFYSARMLGIPTSSSLSEEAMAGTLGLFSFEVEVTALDRWLGDRGISGIELVKLDTESTEPDVLRGLRQVLERDAPDVICEVLPDLPRIEEELEAIVRPLGYRTYLLTDAGPAARGPIRGDPSRRYRNWLFSRREAAFASAR